MPSILFYCNRFYNFTGGLDVIMLFLNYLKQNNKSVYLCPILKNIPSLHITTQLNDIPLDNLRQQDLNNFFNDLNVPGLCSDKTSINLIDTSLIVPINILKKKDNIIIYFENVIGNPSMQKYVVRWLLFFPLPHEIRYYNFNTEYICFFSDYIFNFYKHICMILNIPDLLTENINNPKILRILKFNKNLFNNIQKTPNNNSSFTIRKFFPPVSFRNITNAINVKYIKEIKLNILNKIYFMKKQNTISYTNTKKLIKKYKSRVTRDDVIVHVKNKYKNYGFDELLNIESTEKYIEYFKNKNYFISFDLFTFTSIIASLCGCISVVKPIDGIDFETWISLDPLNKYGVAYGNKTINHAINTRHLLLEHVNNTYMQNENNVINFIYDIESFFNIKIDNII